MTKKTKRRAVKLKRRRAKRLQLEKVVVIIRIAIESKVPIGRNMPKLSCPRSRQLRDKLSLSPSQIAIRIKINRMVTMIQVRMTTITIQRMKRKVKSLLKIKKPAAKAKGRKRILLAKSRLLWVRKKPPSTKIRVWQAHQAWCVINLEDLLPNGQMMR